MVLDPDDPKRNDNGADSTMPRVLVIIPAYNEEETILSVVNSIQATGFDYIVVNDGSRDHTLAICREHNLNVLDLPQNLGIGGAVQAGHKYAKRFGYDIDIQFDGDGQHDARFLRNLVNEILRGSDLAIGSRYLDKNSKGFRSSVMRRVGKTWLSCIINIFAHVRVTDPTSGFRACGRKAIDLFCDNYPLDYPEPESIAVAAKNGFSITEIPVEMHERQGGVSSISPLASVYFMIKVSLAILIACASGKKGR